MTEPANARKTYMMLSNANAERFVADLDGRHLYDHPLTYVSKVNYDDWDAVNNRWVTRSFTQTVPIYTFRFPAEFINSKNPRWVEIHHVKMLHNNHATSDIIMHSDIIQRDPYLDHTVMVVNETRTKYKKYAYTQQKDTFTIWFTSFAQPDVNIETNEISFMAELMLIY